MALILVLGLAVFIGPRHAARYVVAQELDRLGIVHNGVETINIDLWEQEASFGPLRFRVAKTDAGQVGRFKLKLELWNLLSRRAVINSVIVQDVDIRVTRAQDGGLALNGISLKELTESKTPSNPDDDDDKSEPWHAGLEKLELRNSRLVFIQTGKGKATIQVDRLTLAGFRTWEPDNPGTFDLKGRLNDISLEAKGDARPFADRISVALSAKLRGAAIAKIEQLTGSIGFQQNEGALDGDFTVDGSLFADGRAEAKFKGRFKIANVNLSREGMGSVGLAAAVADVDVQHKLGKTGDQAASGTVSVKLSAPHFKTNGSPPIAAKNIDLSLNNLSASLSAGMEISLQVHPSMTIDGFHMEGPNPVSVGALKVDLPSLRLSGPSDNIAVKTAGTINTRAITVKVASEQALEMSLDNVSLDLSDLTATLSDTKPEWRARLALTVEGNKTSVANGDAATASIRKLSVGNISANQDLDIEVGEILITGLQAVVSEKIMPPSTPPEEQKPDSPKSAVQADKIKPDSLSPVFRVGRFAFTDAAKIGFKDSSVSPPIDLKIGIETLDIKSLNSAEPSAKSDVSLKATINQFTGVQVTGWAAPFGNKPDFDLKVGVTGLELTRFSAYAARAVGMNLDSGQLTLDATAKAAQSVLDGKLKINVKDLKFQALSPEDEKKLSGAVGMPLQTAVGLLQDSNDVIKITVPVSGSVAKPEFDLSDAIGQAIGGALKSLFPPTALASMLASAGSSGITFKPIPYASGTAKLGVKATTYADRLVELLSKRPKLSVRVCGRATAADLENFAVREFKTREAAIKLRALAAAKSAPAPKPTAAKPASKSKITPMPVIRPLTGAALYDAALPKLSKLALDRTKTIRSYLLKKGKNIRGRVSECRSAFDPKDKDLPRVNVAL